MQHRRWRWRRVGAATAAAERGRAARAVLIAALPHLCPPPRQRPQEVFAAWAYPGPLPSPFCRHCCSAAVSYRVALHDRKDCHRNGCWLYKVRQNAWQQKHIFDVGLLCVPQPQGVWGVWPQAITQVAGITDAEQPRHAGAALERQLQHSRRARVQRPLRPPTCTPGYPVPSRTTAWLRSYETLCAHV